MTLTNLLRDTPTGRRPTPTKAVICFVSNQSKLFQLTGVSSVAAPRSIRQTTGEKRREDEYVRLRSCGLSKEGAATLSQTNRQS